MGRSRRNRGRLSPERGGVRYKEKENDSQTWGETKPLKGKAGTFSTERDCGHEKANLMGFRQRTYGQVEEGYWKRSQVSQEEANQGKGEGNSWMKGDSKKKKGLKEDLAREGRKGRKEVEKTKRQATGKDSGGII